LAETIFAVTEIQAELWHSLASLLRSYTAAHGLNGNRQATAEWDENRIVMQHAGRRLDLHRQGATVHWKRENGTAGTLELTGHGRLRGLTPDGVWGEEELDLAAEAWARNLMHGD